MNIKGEIVEEATKRVAIIDIGASAIRIVISELYSNGEFRKLDRANRPVTLGIDVFKKKFIGQESIFEALNILSSFQEMIKGWDIDKENQIIIATSAVREARNRDNFIDRVQLKTGLKIRVIDGVEENYLTYIAVQHAIRDMKMSFSKANSLIIEVGGGSTELMIMSRGRMVHASSLKIGTIRLEQQIRGAWDSGFPLESYLREQLRLTIEQLKEEQHLSKVRYAILVGGDARIIAYRIGDKLGDRYSMLTKESLFEITNKLTQGSIEDCMDKMGITIHEAEALIPALLVYKIFLEEFTAIDVLVPDVSIREGVLIETVLAEKGAWDTAYAKQIAATAWALARRYHVDEDHTQNVVDLSLQIFDQITAEHGLYSRERLYLEISAILHDIGYYISNTSHHKHGQYVVENSEIFGLAKEDIQIVSNVVRYHRGSKPMRNHPEFNALSREMRLVVMKLAAILRVADSLDRSHAQNITKIKIELNQRKARFLVNTNKDLEVERFALNTKGKYFEEVFGYEISLETRR